MTLEEIKQAVDQGKKVHWSNEGYEVIKDSTGQYLISYRRGAGNWIGLTWSNGQTLNGDESDFFVGESDPNPVKMQRSIATPKGNLELTHPFRIIKNAAHEPELIVKDTISADEIKEFEYEFDCTLQYVMTIQESGETLLRLIFDAKEGWKFAEWYNNQNKTNF